LNESYKEMRIFLKKNPLIIWAILLVAIIMSPLKSNFFTILTPVFFQIFFISGILGVARDYEKLSKVGFKAIFVNSTKNFPYTIFNIFHSFTIFIVDFILVMFFTILPIVISGAGIDEKYSKILIIISILPIIIYRAPLFLLSAVTPAAVNKEGGKYGIIKIKEILWQNSKFFISVIAQVLIYVLIIVTNFYMQSVILVDNSDMIKIFFFTLFDVLGEVFITLALISNFYFYLKNINEDEILKEKINEHTYKGRYAGFIGKFVM